MRIGALVEPGRWDDPDRRGPIRRARSDRQTRPAVLVSTHTTPCRDIHSNGWTIAGEGSGSNDDQARAGQASGNQGCDEGGNRSGLWETVPGARERDTRSPGKRRADAFVHLVETAARVLDGTARPVGELGGTAKLVITMDYNTLFAGLQATGAIDPDGNPDPTFLPGVGRTADGGLPGTLRRHACGADLIPMVLGGDSEPLDVGRAKRLFTGALRTAIIQRDRGCTFPDCDRQSPPSASPGT